MERRGGWEFRGRRWNTRSRACGLTNTGIGLMLASCHRNWDNRGAKRGVKSLCGRELILITRLALDRFDRLHRKMGDTVIAQRNLACTFWLSKAGWISGVFLLDR